MSLFEHKELDYQKTKRNIHRAVHVYEKSLTRLESNSQPRITPTYTMDMPSSSNGFNSKVENIVLYKEIDSDKDLEYIQKVSSVLNSMKLDYRMIIIESFFNNESNYNVAEKLNLGLTQLVHKKRIAVELFAYGMGIEKYM